MNKSFKTTAQAGFTLIELIVVIVILGILAATAMPKFMNLGGDARVATLQSARGGFNSIVAMAHARWMADATATKPTSTTVEGITMAYDTYGYPTASKELVQIAAPDFKYIEGPNTADDNSPTLGSGEIAVVPAAVFGTPTAKTCYFKYVQATAVTQKPSVTDPPHGDACQ